MKRFAALLLSYCVGDSVQYYPMQFASGATFTLRRKSMRTLTTDYLVIGSGAVSMAFVDTMLDQSDAKFIIVDRHHQPGGHWNDAYPFVNLHQPSALYGVASTELGSGNLDKSGPNAGHYELASGPEISAYFAQVMTKRFLSSGRVQYFPMHDYQGNGEFRSLLSGDKYQVSIKRRLVDGTFFNTSVPSTHSRKFTVADNISCIAPNDLPKRAEKYTHYAVLGGGKTAMDAIVWLLSKGAKAKTLTWVCPRDSWLINRATTQPGKAFFTQTVGAVAKQFDAMMQATSLDDLFLRLESAGNMLRVNSGITPSMFHYATISEGEQTQLASIEHIIRNEKVSRIDADGLQMQSGARYNMPENTLFIDCTATAAVFIGDRTTAVFQQDRIVLQAVYAPLVTYSASIIAFVEANFNDEKQKNKLCTAVCLADTPAEWVQSTSQNMMNQNMWNQIPEMRAWLANCRLNPSYAANKEKALAEPENAALMQQIGKMIMPALVNAQNVK